MSDSDYPDVTPEDALGIIRCEGCDGVQSEATPGAGFKYLDIWDCYCTKCANCNIVIEEDAIIRANYYPVTEVDPECFDAVCSGTCKQALEGENVTIDPLLVIQQKVQDSTW